MRTRRLRTIMAALTLLGTLVTAMPAFAETTAQPQSADYSKAQFVMAVLGKTNQETGLRLVEGQPDGQTEGVDSGGRKSLPNQSGTERWFYFDVHDSYMNGGLNKVRLTVNYVDNGLTPIYLEYDSFDTVRPDSKDDAVVKKRVPLVNRTNSESVKSITVELEDARFAGNQPGNADFRIGSGDDLTIRNVAVLRVSYEKPMPPIRVVLDGKEVAFDVVPFVDPQTGRTLVPMRAMLNALGVANTDIAWNEATRTVQARKGQTTVVLTIDNPVAFVKDRPVTLDQPAVIRAGRTLVPLRFVSQEFGLRVEWNEQLRVITLTSTTAP